MQTDPLVSVIIPVFNAEKYLEASITSAIGQTWNNKEIIVIDDGSTDNSLAIATRFENVGVKVITQKNSGAGVARNKGLDLAKGDFIQFLDADDLLSPNKIEEQIKLLKNKPGYLALCTTIHFQDGTLPGNYPVHHEWYKEGTEDPVDFLIKLYGGDLIGPTYGGMIQPNAWLTPRDLILKAGKWNEIRSPDDDGEFFCRIILESKGIVYADKAINHYRKFNVNHSLSGQKDYESLRNIFKSLDLKTNYLLAHTNREDAKLALSRLYYENALIYYPRFPELYKESLLKAQALAPYFNFNPYCHGLPYQISRVLGWRVVRYLQFFKNKYIS